MLINFVFHANRRAAAGLSVAQVPPIPSGHLDRGRPCMARPVSVSPRVRLADERDKLALAVANPSSKIYIAARKPRTKQAGPNLRHH